MFSIDPTMIRRAADSGTIFERGKKLHAQGAYHMLEADREAMRFVYEIDGSYGDYLTEIQFTQGMLHRSCSCPYPGQGCKHVVAVLFDVAKLLARDAPDTTDTTDTAKTAVAKPKMPILEPEAGPVEDRRFLTQEELKQQVLEERAKRARKEDLRADLGDMLAGEHVVRTTKDRVYTVTLHNPLTGEGHCTCPDFLNNQLGTCKHMLFLLEQCRQRLPKDGSAPAFPFLDVYWDSRIPGPRLFGHSKVLAASGLEQTLGQYFDDQGRYRDPDLSRFPALLDALDGAKIARVRPSVRDKVSKFFDRQELLRMETQDLPSLEGIQATLYPYQIEGVRYALYKNAALIGDEMGLGKTLQAIVLGVLKKQVFGFSRILVVTLASLKDQWKREVERFTSERAEVIGGSFRERRRQYLEDSSLFKISNYEAVLRDEETLAAYAPDLVILDEAQRIKNFNTKTAESIKRVPRSHSLVLTGTPLENRLEDLYSIVQFLDPDLLSPLWRFAADHYLLSREKKDHILGYRNLNALHKKLQPLVLRRRKKEVLRDLPAQITNTYYVDLHPKQASIHRSLASQLSPLLNKKYLTPMDVRRIQELLLCMRRVCDSTYLIDRETQISPKLEELRNILRELVEQSDRKVVIFSEWTAMTYLIGKLLSDLGIPFVELSGKIPVPKRQALIDEFTNNPECRIFLSTDAGGTGLNLQAADCVINFEPPWNPAKVNQRIGRVNRIGQTSSCVNVINLVAKDSIEERILAGLQLKTDLFKGVIDGQGDQVDFSQEKRNQLLNQLRELLAEEPTAMTRSTVSEDLPEDTPHYLNPEVLGDKEGATAISDEELQDVDIQNERPQDEMSGEAEKGAAAREPGEQAPRSHGENVLAGQPPEKIERVLNNGMEFLSGLFEMATGQKMERTEKDKPLISIDRSTGEVTMRFKLPVM